MKNSHLKNHLVLAAGIAAIFVLPLNSALAKPGGLYKGITSGRLFNGVSIPGNIPTEVRIPNKKGKVTGTYNINTVITGRVRKSIERNKGKKFIKRGNWTWFVGPGGAATSGPFSIIIKKVGKTYRFRPPEKVNITTAAAWNFKATLTGSK